MVNTRVGILALQGAVAEHERLLTGLGASVAPVRRPAQLDGLSALVIPGGESTAIAWLAASTGLLPAVRERVDAGLAVLGTCAGLILLADRVLDADALAGFDRVGGLDVTVRRNGYGGQLESFEADTELSVDGAPGDRMRAAFIRAPIIEDVGPGVETIARHEGQPIAVRQGRLVAATFHPEITGEDRLHRLFLDLATQRAADFAA
ncbi:MAG TPA: pyridoxal 5'-phosphate synthase glutaminase subunit PdxT [Candidatus Agrococcus pullicola]|uniref:Pyridoxal 5'-phosphate synthase subunit PdxT n=1 Tax=Candidatus Agrococcus pullicola TaxID=2838429 RepID=A0A9D1YXQ8_9MICO|nr:pyridoxal 5'-phosphate synthase glutaminase subunit PdxT [Candidatus Agrococcus pullicola]